MSARRWTLFFGFLLVPCLALPSRAQTLETDLARQVLVKLRPSASRSAVGEARSLLEAKTLRVFPRSGVELWQIDAMSAAEAVALFAADPRFEIFEPNAVVSMPPLDAGEALEAPGTTAVFPNDPRFTMHWNLHNTGQNGGTVDADIDAPEAWDVETGGSVLVAILDTGIAYDHPDLAANVFINPNETVNGLDDDGNGYVDDTRGWNCVAQTNDAGDDNGHGTGVAGIIAAVGNNAVGGVGVSWSARLMPVKVLASNGSGTLADIIQGIEYAAAMGARVIDGGFTAPSAYESLRLAIEACGSLYVAPAGNSAGNSDTSPLYPGSFDLDNVISVAATTRTDTRASFSNYGATSVDLGAPGATIPTTTRPAGYIDLSSTSMSAAHVAGALCLLWSMAPGLPDPSAKALLLSSVDPLAALQGKTVSGGRLNVSNLLAQVAGVDAGAAGPSIRLRANQPNPFRSSTTIAFDLERPGDVSLAIYDVRGRRVRDLEAEAMAAGPGSVVWDGSGVDGRPVPAGIYFVRLAAGSRLQSRRMVLVR